MDGDRECSAQKSRFNFMYCNSRRNPAVPRVVPEKVGKFVAPLLLLLPTQLLFDVR